MNPSIHTAQVLPARAVLFLGIAGFHALLAYLFASGLIARTIKVLVPDKPMVIFDVERPSHDTEPPPPSQVPTQLITEVADPLPLPPIIPMVDPPVTSEPISTTSLSPAATDAPTPAPPIRLVGRNVMPNTADYYPPNEIRLGKEGTAEVQSCVDEQGKLDGTPTIEATSGREPLDRAAVRLARDGKYARAMRGETPVPNCYRFRVTFTLH